MKRVQSACLLQTLHFQLNDDLGHEAAARAVRDEVAHYKAQLDRSHTKYKIEEERAPLDDSILIKVKK